MPRGGPAQSMFHPALAALPSGEEGQKSAAHLHGFAWRTPHTHLLHGFAWRTPYTHLLHGVARRTPYTHLLHGVAWHRPAPPPPPPPRTCCMANDSKMLNIARPNTTSTPAAAISIEGMPGGRGGGIRLCGKCGDIFWRIRTRARLQQPFFRRPEAPSTLTLPPSPPSPFSAPNPFFCRSSMPVTTTVGEMADRRNPAIPASRNGIPYT